MLAASTGIYTPTTALLPPSSDRKLASLSTATATATATATDNNTRTRRRPINKCRVSSSSTSSPLSLNPKPSSFNHLLKSLAKTFAGTTAVTLILNQTNFPAFISGGGGGGHGSNGGGGGGGGGGCFACMLQKPTSRTSRGTLTACRPTLWSSSAGSAASRSTRSRRSCSSTGTVTFQHRNINGLNRSLIGSVSSSNLYNPQVQGDLDFKLEYVHPYLDGVDNPRDRTLRVSCFNGRKLSPVFTGGPGDDEVPPVWVDRAGMKANITENLSRQSKFTYGLVMEEITTRDEQNHICSNGQRVLPSGGVSEDGPPTTLSGTGIDHMAFLQSNITHDNTKFVNGTLVGERNVFQVDQGLGIGSKFPFFNRHQLSLTRFFQLKEVEEGAGKPPPSVLVLHGHYGGCVGDLPSYDAFTLGGPYSVRGYNMGEIGAARHILELAAELRIPVKGENIYAFVEHGNDLGSSKDVKGNPTEVYRRVGHGSSYGVGVKLGPVRVEYVVDHNSGTGSTFFRFGDRF